MFWCQTHRGQRDLGTARGLRVCPYAVLSSRLSGQRIPAEPALTCELPCGSVKRSRARRVRGLWNLWLVVQSQGERGCSWPSLGGLVGVLHLTVLAREVGLFLLLKRVFLCQMNVL